MKLLGVLHTWGFAVLGAALVLVAFLVNRFAPAKRRRLRYALFLYVSFLALAGAASIVRHVPAESSASWAGHVQLFADLFAAFAVVHVTAIALFDVALPVARVSPVAIMGDLIVGFAYAFAALGVLRASGLTASSVVATSAVVSGVLALSLQATLGNILGGVALQLDGSVHVGDWVKLADGTQGKVTAIRWRHTVIETRNWDTVVVPNATLLAQNIVILGKRAGRPVQSRTWVYFNVDFRFAPSQVVSIVQSALSASPIEGVAAEPLPSVICYDLARDGRDSFGYYAVRYWLSDLANDDPTSSRVRARIYSALQRAGVPLARPVQTLLVQQEEGAAARGIRERERKLRALEGIELFHSLTPDERDFIAGHLTYAPFTAGETCTKQGAVAHWLYILCSGKVDIRRHTGDESSPAKSVAMIDAPNFFGEMGLMTGEPRTADVVAVTDVECYRLDKPGLQRILEERPEAAEQFSGTLARRRVELAAALEDLDAAAKSARIESEQLRILDKIQGFFGLARTTRA
jgi:small-conductance mechanosensitive channel/CRP-like cAMP-binding protein